MSKRNIDLSDIKENDLDKTSSFTDLMSRSERRNRLLEKENIADDIEDMIDEKKKTTKDLTIELEKAKQEYEKNISNENEENLSKTQILDITRQMKFNLEETKKENKKKKGISIINIVGELNLICIGYYIYLLIFTDYQDSKLNYTINGSIIIFLVLLYGLSIIINKKFSKIFSILNMFFIFVFIVFNLYSLIY